MGLDKEMDIFMTRFVASLIDSLEIKELEELNLLVNLDDEKLISIKKKESFPEQYPSRICCVFKSSQIVTTNKM